jgi:RNA polymerase sigma-70 factor, ECF subfamily
LACRSHKLINVPGEQQFEAVLQAYQDKVFRLCCAMIGNRALAEETAQEVFVRIWKALPGYRGESSLSTWIYSITRNACLTCLKKKAGRRDFSLDIPSVRQAAERTAGGLQTPDRHPDILRLVGELPAHYRQVILLYYMEGKSYEELSTMLDLPLGTVKTYLHRARKQLSEVLAALDKPAMEENGV